MGSIAQVTRFTNQMDYDFGSYTLQDFIKWVSNSLGKQFVIRQMPLFEQTGAYGMWLTSSLAEVILHDSSLSPIHREHIILHELSHCLLNHRTERLATHEVEQILANTKQPPLGTMRRVLDQCGTQQPEAEAEHLAAWIRTSANRSQTNYDPSLQFIRQYDEGWN